MENLFSDFKINRKMEEFDDMDYEIELEKEILESCAFGEYVDKFEMEEKSDEELLTLEKQEIIDFKNEQIKQLKKYINSLIKEKEDLIESYKETADILVEKIKQEAETSKMERPGTAFIANNINETNIKNRTNTNVNTNKTTNSQNGQMVIEQIVDKKRCPNCKQILSAEEMVGHNLICLRRTGKKCQACKEVILDSESKAHLDKYRDINMIYQAITERDKNLLKSCFSHGFLPDKIIDAETNESIIHLIARNADEGLLEVLIGEDVSLNLQNNKRQTALIIAIENKLPRIAKILIEVGADVHIRDKSDNTPLMLACRNNMIETVEKLIQFKANINEGNILGETPLKIAQICGNEDLALHLIQKYKATTRPSSKQENKNSNKQLQNL